MPGRLKNIKLLAMDVDGTLTDGGVLYVQGEQLKTFDIHDGLGIRLAMVHGLGIAWVTGNLSPAVAARAKSLGVTDLYEGVRHKTKIIQKIAQDHNLSTEEIAFIGDDLNDLPAYDAAGFCFAVGNAVEEVKRMADFVTKSCGGRGAVREAIEVIIKAKGEWDTAVAEYLCELELEEAKKQGPEAVA